MIKRTISTILLCALVFVFNISITHGTPIITAPNGILIDYATGQVLYDKNAHKIAYPASTTKIMTAILVLENANLNETITIDEDLYVDGSSMYLLRGEAFTVKELLQVLLIRSANDVAEVFAKHISGSVEAFADLMNERARELGAYNTNFTNPHGLPDENHFTTAYDLAMISQHAMTMGLFREIVSTTRLTLEETEFTPEKRYYRNTNRFLWGTGPYNQILHEDKYTDIKYDIVDGIKTGYTNDAKQCLVASSIKDGRRLISVVLGAKSLNVYADTRKLIDYGYDNFSLIQLANKNNFKTDINIKWGLEDKAPLYFKESLGIVLPKSTAIGDIDEKLLFNDAIKAPIYPGDVLGRVAYYLEGQLIGEVELVAKKRIDKKSLLKRFPLIAILLKITCFLFALWQGFVIFIRVKRRKANREIMQKF